MPLTDSPSIGKGPIVRRPMHRTAVQSGTHLARSALALIDVRQRLQQWALVWSAAGAVIALNEVRRASVRPETLVEVVPRCPPPLPHLVVWAPAV